MDKHFAAAMLEDCGHTDIFTQAMHFSVVKPFYSTYIYGVSFGDQDADMRQYTDYMIKNNLTKRKRVLELFGGTAFESAILKEKYPANSYWSIDSNPVYEEEKLNKGVNYITGFVDSQLLKSNDRSYDLAFIGGTNKSLCSIKGIKSLSEVALFCKNYVKKSGSLIVSGFEDPGFDETPDYKVEYDVYKIKHHPLYRGKWCHWGMVTKRDPKTKLHYYFPLIIISNYRRLEAADRMQDRIIAYYVPEDYESYKSWGHDVVRDIFYSVGGFVPVEQPSISGGYIAPDISFMTFKKS